MDQPYCKKLIEVALPLELINKASYRENYIYKGNPSSIHKWWAQRPFAACRAVIFASLIDDPSQYLDDKEAIADERNRLFEFIEQFIQWESMNDQDIIDKAKLEIARSIARKRNLDLPIGKNGIDEFLKNEVPPLVDPFAGGGTIPLEGLRLGLRVFSSDLNPIAVLLNKALLEFPANFSDLPPIHPTEKKTVQETYIRKGWSGSQGLAEDIQYYGASLVTLAKKRIGNFYPEICIPDEMGGGKGTIIAWLWARTITCQNPACFAEMPLMRSFSLSTKKGRERWAKPEVDFSNKPPTINFFVADQQPNIRPPKLGRGARFRCLACEQVVQEEYLRQKFSEKDVGIKLVAIVADSKNGRIYLSPDEDQENTALNTKSNWIPNTNMDTDTPDLVSGRGYGIEYWHELFTNRQLLALDTFYDLLSIIETQIIADCEECIEIKPEYKEISPSDYATAIKTYLAFACDKYAMYGNSHVSWYTKEDRPSMLFSRQAIPMVWDFVEVNPFSGIGGSISKSIQIVADSINPIQISTPGNVSQRDATTGLPATDVIISTDPPYYDNISYSVLSDFFYVWLRKALRKNYPELFSTMLVPKEQEIVAAPYRFAGNQQDAKDFFENGLRLSFRHIHDGADNDYPITIYYAYRQEETSQSGEKVSTGWETMLEALIDSNLIITGTWPLRTERSGRSISFQTNALETSVLLVCRQNISTPKQITRKEFRFTLKNQLSKAIEELMQGNIAPVDMAQAAIGPGMAVFSRYKQVLEADGSKMSVQKALALINQILDEILAEQEGEFDTDTRWALAWYEQYGFGEGPYGVAESLSKAKNTSVGGLEQAGILKARSGKVNLFHRSQLADDWDPTKDNRLIVWEVTQYLIRALEHGGENEAAFLISRIGSLGENARDLAYRLYTICDRKGWAQDALGYNMLVVAWPRLKEMARQRQAPTQEQLF